MRGQIGERRNARRRSRETKGRQREGRKQIESVDGFSKRYSPLKRLVSTVLLQQILVLLFTFTVCTEQSRYTK